MSTVLIVDDEARILMLLESLLKSAKFDVLPAKDGPSALQTLDEHAEIDFVLTDLRMPGMDGLELFAEIRKRRPGMPVILLTAYASLETALDAMRGGIFDYITKPFKVNELMATIRAADRQAQSRKTQLVEALDVAEATPEASALGGMIATAPTMQPVCETLRKVAPHDITVLINGESGTGKEVVARTLHALGPRAKGPWVAVNCAALPEPLLESELFGHMKGAFTGATADKKGLVEAANGGTLFLDEISSMPLSLQGKLLRCLQEREIRRVGGLQDIPVNVRLVAASNADLEQLVAAGTFRADLYYRLAVVSVNLPALRQRREDILPLAKHFIDAGLPKGLPRPALSNGTAEILTHYTWPGNVRELENVITHALAFREGSEVILPAHLPSKLAAALSVIQPPSAQAPGTASTPPADESLKGYLRQKEREYLRQILDRCNGDKTEAAHILQVSVATLYRKLSE